MWLDRVSNAQPLAYKSVALPKFIAQIYQHATSQKLVIEKIQAKALLIFL